MYGYEEKAKKWFDAMVAMGHTPCMNKHADSDEPPRLDIFAYSEGHHNGPACEACSDYWCWHCSGIDSIHKCKAKG